MPVGQAQTVFELTEKSAITIHGTSTLHDWKATVPKYEASFEATDAAAKKKLKTETIFESATLKFDVETIDGGRGPSMNKKIKAALKSTEHPHIVFKLKEPAQIKAITDKNDETFILEAIGELSMAGASKNITMQLEGQRLADQSFAFKARIPLKMSDFSIEPPSAMFGQIVTKDDIEVEFDLFLKSKN